MSCFIDSAAEEEDHTINPFEVFNINEDIKGLDALDLAFIEQDEMQNHSDFISNDSEPFDSVSMYHALDNEREFKVPAPKAAPHPKKARRSKPIVIEDSNSPPPMDDDVVEVVKPPKKAKGKALKTKKDPVPRKARGPYKKKPKVAKAHPRTFFDLTSDQEGSC